MDLEFNHVFVPADKFDELLIKAMKQKYYQKIRVKSKLIAEGISVTYFYNYNLTYIYYN